jgi:hypothetical protein
VGATDGRLDQEGVRLAGRPVNGTLVSHIKIDGNPGLFPVTDSVISLARIFHENFREAFLLAMKTVHYL